MKLFGTDGIRFIYSEKENAVAYALGEALCILSGKTSPIIVVGRDTRRSGPTLTSALIGGITDNGGIPINIGVLPTNAVSFFTRSTQADFGVMVSASHNAPEYNGFKVFDGRGFKIGEREAMVIEKLMSRYGYYIKPTVTLKEIENAEELYRKHVLKKCGKLDRLRVLVDCANGSAGSIAHSVFKEAGIEARIVNDDLSGERINDACGAAFPLSANKLPFKEFDLTFMYDGDADRLAVYEGSNYIDGDRLFYIFCKYLKECNEIEDKAVGTVLLNGGVERALSKIGVSLLRSDVGDGSVHRLMRKAQCVFGGESSGHYMNFRLTWTCDAVVNSLFLCKIKQEKGSLYDYSRELEIYPSYMLNVDCREFTEIKDLRAIAEKYEDVKTVIRRSGTEPLLRIYAESDNKSVDELMEICNELAYEVKE